MANEISEIEIISGEGDGAGTRERCGGDRWARVEINGRRVSDDQLEDALRFSSSRGSAPGAAAPSTRRAGPNK